MCIIQYINIYCIRACISLHDNNSHVIMSAHSAEHSSLGVRVITPCSCFITDRYTQPDQTCWGEIHAWIIIPSHQV